MISYACMSRGRIQREGTREKACDQEHTKALLRDPKMGRVQEFELNLVSHFYKSTHNHSDDF